MAQECGGPKSFKWQSSKWKGMRQAKDSKTSGFKLSATLQNGFEENRNLFYTVREQQLQDSVWLLWEDL